MLPIWLQQDHSQSFLGQVHRTVRQAVCLTLSLCLGIQLLVTTPWKATIFTGKPLCSLFTPISSSGTVLELRQERHLLWVMSLRELHKLQTHMQIKKLNILHYLYHSRSSMTCNSKYLSFDYYSSGPGGKVSPHLLQVIFKTKGDYKGLFEGLLVVIWLVS